MENTNFKRESDGYHNATEYLKLYNNTHKKKRLNDFFKLSKTKKVCKFLSKKLNLENVSVSKRGHNGATYMHESLFVLFQEWLCLMPFKDYHREEKSFFNTLEITFKDIFSFEYQKNIKGYIVDIYCEDLNLCIEYDERRHKYNIEKDIERQKYIESKIKCTFLRHSEFDSIFEFINKILKHKQTGIGLPFDTPKDFYK